MSKAKSVYEYLLTGASITQRDSVAMFNLYALSQTLGRLRLKKGIPIKSTDEVSTNGTKYTRYWLDRAYIEKVKSGEIKRYA
ncbi:hypothetical protein [Moraxella nasicaprae]|uniref:DNA-binding protein n=1 Tax=Moraxella nasicaprae TaxID=2904122 RepID=A0ABY6F675_9GAMM|nr:hypothetical protein [Moraxella nasicaprae]UXZ05543.1 hypothetical protein LU297_03605 [Moraxella nasicaprae]